MITDFRDRVAVITGGGSGIGLAVARVLGGLGARLVLADIEAPALQDAERTLAAEGCVVEGLRIDVGERNDMDRLADFEGRAGTGRSTLNGWPHGCASGAWAPGRCRTRGCSNLHCGRIG